MSRHLNRGRDLAGWLGASAVTAAVFAGAAAAAFRAVPGPVGAGEVQAVALDLSVGVVPLSAVVPSEPPPVVEMTAPERPQAPQAELAPELPPALPVPEPEPAAMRDLPAPALEIPQAEAPPVMTATPPPPQVEAPPLDLAHSPRPMARPDRAMPETAEKPEARQAEAPRPTAPLRTAEPEPDPAPRAQAQATGSDQAARPAQERRVAGGKEAARYGDRVMRQIARLRRQKAPERGVVTVGFEIGPDGGLRRVAVVSSSGHTALDQVAMDHIRRAAPFPPPPEGAATRFAFEFVGK